ncbi:MAG TPA: hypothetical protein DCS93_30295 [Microscillaceae bacterium]|nr:hypothetical protein [Microscillaceae bacterium]
MQPDRFVFYSKSADIAPGSGTHEFVAEQSKYINLAATPHWRRILGNFYECAFVYENRTYYTLEHALQAKKFQAIDQILFESFAQESQSALAFQGGVEARKMRKTIMLTPAQLAKWDQEKIAHVENMQWAKFSQCIKAREVLLATQQAELWHFLARAPKGRNLQHWTSLENVRARLQQEEK